jgi:hypothetical protein
VLAQAGRRQPSVCLEAESRLHGAALALREFIQHGCDLATPLAHLDVTAASGAHATLQVRKVLELVAQSGPSGLPSVVRDSGFIDREP